MKSILIIEDNKDLVENISFLLKENGFDVFAAFNGKDGLKLFSLHNPSIILCDIMLPDINGYKILTELKKVKKTDFPIFIFLTAKAQRMDQRKGMELGADDFITKPFTFDELTRCINTQIKKRNILSAAHHSTIPTINKMNNSSLSYNDFIFVDDKLNQGLYPLKEIAYIKSMKDYTNIFLQDNKRFLLRKSMFYWEKKLPKEKFLRIHRQTIVNLDFIGIVSKISSNRYCVSIKGMDIKLNVSQRFVKRLKEINE